MFLSLFLPDSDGDLVNTLPAILILIPIWKWKSSRWWHLLLNVSDVSSQLCVSVVEVKFGTNIDLDIVPPFSKKKILQHLQNYYTDIHKTYTDPIFPSSSLICNYESAHLCAASYSNLLTQILLRKWRQMDRWVIDICLSSFGQIFNTLTCISPQEGNPASSFWLGLVDCTKVAQTVDRVFLKQCHVFQSYLDIWTVLQMQLLTILYLIIFTSTRVGHLFLQKSILAPNLVQSHSDLFQGAKHGTSLQQEDKYRISFILVFSRFTIQPKRKIIFKCKTFDHVWIKV